MDSDSRNASPMLRWTSTGAPSPCAPLAAAVDTERGPGRPDGGMPSAATRRVQMKPCVAPVSSKIIT